jgi:4-hydroxy 2-oxovalerate aldolase
MLSDNRFSEEDILAAIEHLKEEGGKKFSIDSLNATRNFYQGENSGNWAPSEVLSGKPVLIIGAGPSTSNHKVAIESFVRKYKPVVVALNTQSTLAQELIDLRVASHPVRLLADCDSHVTLPQPLITPVSCLPKDVIASLEGKEMFDFGLDVVSDTFLVKDTSATLPNSLVISYALAIAASGCASTIYLAGFDGFGPGDNRTQEMQKVFNAFKSATDIDVISITNTEYDIKSKSVYGM